MNKTTLIRVLTYGAFLSFFLFGFADNLKGPTLPALLDELRFSYSSGGTMVMGVYLGFLTATLLTGMLSDYAGNKVVIFVACFFLSVGMLVFSLSSSFWVLTGAMVVSGLGLGALEIGGNLIIIDLHPQDKGRYLNLLAFFHGAGAMVAPLYAGQLLDMGVSWRFVYQSGLLVVLVLFVYFLLFKYPKTDASSAKLDFKKVGLSAFAGDMLLYHLVLALYVGIEIGIGTWMVEFLQTMKGQTVLMSSFFLSLFFGTITGGRFIGSFLVGRVGYLKSLLFASSAAAVCLGVGLFGPPSLAFFLPLSGFFFSIIFPTVTAAVSDLHQENMGTILGLLFTSAGIGGMLGPWAIGLFSDWVGLQKGFGLVVIFAIVMSLLLGMLLFRQKATTSQADRQTP